MGANSLLDIVVFGRACANHIAEIAKPGKPHAELTAESSGEASLANLDKLRHASGGISTAALRLEMQKVMQNNAAVFRTAETLKEGKALIDQTLRKFPDVKVTDRSMIWYLKLFLRMPKDWNTQRQR